MQYRAISMLSAGHLCVDITQGALPALLPFLITAHHLSYAAAGGLIFSASIASSFVQPIFGHFADRLAKPWLMPAGLALAGICISLVGVVPTYWAMVLAVALCGLGVAAYHPEGARLMNQVAGDKKATAMSLFSVGGNSGFAIGPLLATLFVMHFGLHGTLLLAVPVLAMATALLIWLRHATFGPATAKRTHDTTADSGQEAWGGFAGLSSAVLFRSVIYYAILTFLPLFWIQILHQSKAAGGTALTIFTSAGILGTLIGGRLADRVGYLRIMRGGFLLLAPLLFLFVRSTSVLPAIALVVPIALLYYAPFSAMVVLGQQYLPNRVGLASGVTLGLAVSVGGAVAPLLGWLADRYGIPAMLTGVAFLPILVALIAFLLPAPPSRKRERVGAPAPTSGTPA